MEEYNLLCACWTLQTVPADHPLVSYILVDPSCSGSGIANRVEYHSKAGLTLYISIVARLLIVSVLWNCSFNSHDCFRVLIFIGKF